MTTRTRRAASLLFALAALSTLGAPAAAQSGDPCLSPAFRSVSLPHAKNGVKGAVDSGCKLATGQLHYETVGRYAFDLPQTAVVRLTAKSREMRPMLVLVGEGDALLLRALDDTTAKGALAAKSVEVTLRAGEYRLLVLGDRRGDWENRDPKYDVAIEQLPTTVAADAGGACGQADYQRRPRLVIDAPISSAAFGAEDCFLADGRRAHVWRLDLPTERAFRIAVAGDSAPPALELLNPVFHREPSYIEFDPPSSPAIAFRGADVRAGPYYVLVAEGPPAAGSAYIINALTLGDTGTDARTAGATCTGLADTLEVGEWSTEYGILTPESCRLADGRQYHTYVVDVAKKMDVRIRVHTDAGLPLTWRLSGGGREFTGRWDDDDEAATHTIPAGAYRLEVIGEMPEMSAFFSVSARED